MGDITNRKLLWIKGGLFLALGIGSAATVLAKSPSWRTALLLVITIWAFCRAYYFAFYVIQHYADPTYRFAGLGSFIRHAFGRKNRGQGP